MRPELAFFALVFAISIPIWLVEPGEWPITAAVAAPLVAAVILTSRTQGWGVKGGHIEHGPLRCAQGDPVPLFIS